MDFLNDYGLFLAKILTFVSATLLLIGGTIALLNKDKKRDKSFLEVKKLNQKYEEMAETLNRAALSKANFKKFLKEKKHASKKMAGEEVRKRFFVLQFEGDIKASAVHSLREEITAILNVATRNDEVIVRLDSGGGMVSPYGLAASQLERIRQRRIPLTVTIDKIAASGGYLMAAVADKIISAPFAIIGSIGVLAQVPNFHRLLKKNDIDFEQITAGEFKRTLTLFGENTDKARKKLQEEVEEIHHLFKHFITQNRPKVDIQKVATGEYWMASKALELHLVDELITSDDYLFNATRDGDLFQVTYTLKKPLLQRLFSNVQNMIMKPISAW